MEKDSDWHQHDADSYADPCSQLPKGSDRSVVQLIRRLACEEPFATEFLHALPLFLREMFLHLLDSFEGISFGHVNRPADLNFIRKLRLQLPQTGESLVRSW